MPDNWKTEFTADDLAPYLPNTIVSAINKPGVFDGVSEAVFDVCERESGQRAAPDMPTIAAIVYSNSAALLGGLTGEQIQLIQSKYRDAIELLRNSRGVIAAETHRGIYQIEDTIRL